MSVYVKNLSMFKFRVRLADGKTKDLEHNGSGLDGRYLFHIKNGMTPLECFDPTMGWGNEIVLKGHDNDDDRNEILVQDCPVCGKKAGKYKPGKYEDKAI